MPWTRKQVKYLFSSGSPLSGAQKTKMKSELHAEPAIGHERKGSAEMKKYTGSAANYKFSRPKRKVVKRTY